MAQFGNPCKFTTVRTCSGSAFYITPTDNTKTTSHFKLIAISNQAYDL